MENTPNQAIVAENQKTTKKYPSTRTHIPVDGHKIEELRTLSLEDLIAIANARSMQI